MKRFFYILILAAMMAGCVKEEHPDFITQRVDFEGKEWSNFIATIPSSYDFMTENYVWKDSGTSLTSRPNFISSEWGSYYGGGCTVSNYGSGNMAEKGSYAYDLYVYKEGVDDSRTGCGANGSDNFLVLYHVSDDENCLPEIYFHDGKPRTIHSCDINSTTYFANIVENGNEFSPKLGPDDKIVVTATGFDADGNETATVEFVLATATQTTKEWTTWNLYELGAVVRVRFNITGGPRDDYGMTTPKYFAIDNLYVGWVE